MFYIIKNGTPKDTLKCTIRDCKEEIKDWEIDLRKHKREEQTIETKIRNLRIKLANYEALKIVNGKVVK